MGTYKCSFSTDSNLFALTFQMNTEPSAEPTAIYWPSGLKAARDQSQPTLNPSALQQKAIQDVNQTLFTRLFIETMSILKKKQTLWDVVRV